jgi:hypothetical protein
VLGAVAADGIALANEGHPTEIRIVPTTHH